MSNLLEHYPDSHLSTAKGRTNLSTRIRIHYLLDGDIHTRNTYERPSSKCRNIDPRHRPPLPPRHHAPLILVNVIQPKRPRNAIRIPTRKQTGRNPDQVIKNRYPHRKHKRRRIHDKNQK